MCFDPMAASGCCRFEQTSGVTLENKDYDFSSCFIACCLRQYQSSSGIFVALPYQL